jgi:hypothetical protein
MFDSSNEWCLACGLDVVGVHTGGWVDSTGRDTCPSGLSHVAAYAVPVISVPA